MKKAENFQDYINTINELDAVTAHIDRLQSIKEHASLTARKCLWHKVQIQEHLRKSGYFDGLMYSLDYSGKQRGRHEIVTLDEKTGCYSQQIVLAAGRNRRGRMLKLIIYIIFLLVILGLTWLCHKNILVSRYQLNERYLHCRYLAAYFILLAVVYNRYTFSYILLLIDQIINFQPLQGFWNIILPMRRFELVYLVLSFILSNLILINVTGILFLIVRFLFRRNTQYIDVREMDLPERLLHLPWTVTTRFLSGK